MQGRIKGWRVESRVARMSLLPNSVLVVLGLLDGTHRRPPVRDMFSSPGQKQPMT
jgi:hypothetical protein